MTGQPINILFFAKLREDVQLDKISIELTPALLSINDLIAAISAQYGESVGQCLLADNIVISVNHDVVDREHALKAGDEVAFYPPVTGG